MTNRRVFLKSAFGTTAAGLLTGLAGAQAEPSGAAGSSGGVILQNSDRFDMHSAASGAAYRIGVSWPQAEREGGACFPVVFLLDGFDYFEMVASMAAWLAAAGECPPLVIVGVGYPVSSPAETIRPRLRDFTWVSDAPHDALVRTLSGDDTPVEMAGGENFLRFIEDELKPHISSQYAANVGDASLFCHSLGGLFGLEVLLRAPESFSRYAMSSPPILWAGKDILHTERLYAESHDDLPVKLLLSAGSQETTLEHVLNLPEELAETQSDFVRSLGSPNPLEQLAEFHAALAGRNYAGLDMALQIFPGESHTSTAAVAFLRGLRTLFADVPLVSGNPVGCGPASPSDSLE